MLGAGQSTLHELSHVAGTSMQKGPLSSHLTNTVQRVNLLASGPVVSHVGSGRAGIGTQAVNVAQNSLK